MCVCISSRGCDDLERKKKIPPSYLFTGNFIGMSQDKMIMDNSLLSVSFQLIHKVADMHTYTHISV